MRIELVHEKWCGDDGESEPIPVPCNASEATQTAVAFTDALPDGSEYGYVVVFPGVLASREDIDQASVEAAENTLAVYRKAHMPPEGDDNG